MTGLDRSVLRSGAVAAGEAAHGRYVVPYRDATRAPARLTRRLEARLGSRATHRYRHGLRGFGARLTNAQLGVLQDPRAVANVERDKPARATSTQPLAPGETLPIGVKRIRGLDATSGGVHRASTLGVAVLDTGVDLDHPDLNAKHGVNCVDPGRPAEDVSGHGTAVAGIIGARNDGAGVAFKLSWLATTHRGGRGPGHARSLRQGAGGRPYSYSALNTRMLAAAVFGLTTDEPLPERHRDRDRRQRRRRTSSKAAPVRTSCTGAREGT